MEQPKRVIDAVNLVKYYPITQGIIFKKQVGTVHAVDGITIWLDKGETLAIVGESGCGKSTAGRLLLGLERPTEGTISVLGDDITEMSEKDLRTKRRDIQIILQDPYTSLNPRMTVGSIIGEPFDIHPEVLNGRTKAEAVRALMDKVGLDPEFISRYPHQFSGGQRQRIGVARALALNPDIIVADEPVSALDVSVQAQVMNLLLDLRDEFGLSYIFVSHDLAVVRQIADRIAVMYLGKVVETGPQEAIFAAPSHPYTVALMSAAPIPDPTAQEQRVRIELEGDVPSPIDPPSGCRFRTRCWKAQEICATDEPALLEITPGHLAACHFPVPPEESADVIPDDPEPV
ncbi:MAG: dipeptide ABC transporter ATP-binding protein [Candidatus Nanopelagicales bacterium]|nr:dipeptide ABC transporter ATP-binding protein [Candidatus Nanopelagicales bacterium]